MKVSPGVPYPGSHSMLIPPDSIVNRCCKGSRMMPGWGGDKNQSILENPGSDDFLGSSVSVSVRAEKVWVQEGLLVTHACQSSRH